jgi:subtilase family serine protease
MPGKPEGGDFKIYFEIRPVALPDLQPLTIATYDLVGTSKKLACTQVFNAGKADAGPFNAVLELDGTYLPYSATTAGKLDARMVADLCSEVEMPTNGQHTLRAVIDNTGNVVEINETNNTHEQEYTGAPSEPSGSTTAPEASPESTPTPSPKASPTATPPSRPSEGKPDLTVTSIKLNGQVPDGKADCKDGKNTLAVRVKNSGEADAGTFTVWVSETTADVELGKREVAGLKAGQEQELRFEDVKLKKGPHTIAALADLNNRVSEQDENNNQLEIGASCSGGA